jgi:hypothetical protein
MMRSNVVDNLRADYLRKRMNKIVVQVQAWLPEKAGDHYPLAIPKALEAYRSN